MIAFGMLINGFNYRIHPVSRPSTEHGRYACDGLHCGASHCSTQRRTALKCELSVTSGLDGGTVIAYNVPTTLFLWRLSVPLSSKLTRAGQPTSPARHTQRLADASAADLHQPAYPAPSFR